MRIIFICGSIEPGKDGVGDYTRRLSASLAQKGHAVAMLALYDEFIRDEKRGVEEIDGKHISTLRLPPAMAHKARSLTARAYVEAFNPEWLSLQFVIFGYHPKGLPFWLAARLKFIGRGKKWHIMFHELWLGLFMQSSRKHYLWGMVQKAIIKSILNALKPSSIHTNTALYRKNLLSLGVSSTVLPLFSNIPYVQNKERLPLDRQIANLSPVIFVLFGWLHPFSPVEKFSSDVLAFAKKARLVFQLDVVGKNGPGLARWVSAWKSQGFAVNVHGELPPEDISKVLSHSHVGISTTAFAVVEKSGTVAAMRAHGLPVICVSNPFTPKGKWKAPAFEGVVDYLTDGLGSVFNCREPISSPSTDEVSNQLVSTIKSAN